MYNSLTDTFYSTQIGSFYKFEKEEFDGGAYLVGYARVAKRNKAVCSALSELFVRGELKFSFEVSVGSGRKLDDGTFEIDASDDNFLEGEAVVSFPACEDAVALDLVAECAMIEAESETLNKSGKEENQMTDETKIVETAEDVQTEEIEAETETAVETEISSDQTETIAESEQAAVIVRETQVEENHVSAYDTETGEEISQSVTVVTTREHVEETSAIAQSESETAAAKTDEPEKEKPEDEPKGKDADEPEKDDKPDDEEEASCKKKKCGESDEAMTLIAQLQEEIASLRAELESFKTAQPVIAELNETAVNPFIDDGIELGSTGYGLLEREEKKKVTTYSLLEKA